MDLPPFVSSEVGTRSAPLAARPAPSLGTRGGESVATTGRLLGIARRLRSRAPMEPLSWSPVGRDVGVAGDSRGLIPINKQNGGKRQVTVMTRECWEAALAELGIALDWWLRRANLFVEGVELPRTPGSRILIGDRVRLEVTMECDPCQRMDEIAPGLMAALTPDWRGGICCRVVESGDIRIGDEVRIEPS